MFRMKYTLIQCKQNKDFRTVSEEKSITTPWLVPISSVPMIQGDASDWASVETKNDDTVIRWTQ